MIAIRGAITVDVDTPEQVFEATTTLLSNIFEKNDVQISDVIAVHFSQTEDVLSAYAAKAARGMGLVNAALFSALEPPVVGSLRKCIRVMVQIETEKKQAEAKHVYLRGATVLRPDLTR